MRKRLPIVLLFLSFAAYAQQVDTLDAAVASSRIQANSISKGKELREDLKVSLDEKTVTVTYDPAKTDEATLQKAIEKLGYTAEKVKPDDKR